MNATSTNEPTKIIAAIGFEDRFHKLVLGGINDRADLLFFKTPMQAHSWLHGAAQNGTPPSAILFEYKLLESENFNFIKQLRKLDSLEATPIIGIGNMNQKLDASYCLKKGIDDVYLRPVHWNDLFKRILILHKYKADFIKVKPEPEPQLQLVSFPKRVFDIAFASCVILILSPVMLLIAVLIRLESKGPIIYKSKRVGTGYQIFDFLKFRSMVVDADAQLKNLGHLNQYANRGNSVFVKLENDPRITKVGKFIRKTSLDELPQLFNVIRGEMSIVGNRPLPLYEAEAMVKDRWAQRFLAPAGLTGLWQVTPHGKDNMSAEERVGLDIEYAKTNNLWMDIVILSKTLPAMLQKES